MQLLCPRCRRVLEFSVDRPSFCSYCGQDLAETTPLSTIAFESEAATLPPDRPGANEDSPPEIMGGYRLLRRLGQGGMGAVYEAEEKGGGRRVALKLIAANFVTATDAVERFRQEGRLASKIVHPRCVFVLAADLEAGRPYIVMELMPGSTLQNLVDQRGPLSPEQAVAKILDVIDGLREAHRHGVIHRDVKPSNCFLDADGRVKVGDFGLSKSLLQSGHLTRTGIFLGTPLFASPEQVRGEPVDQQSDGYSVAATLYYLLTGRAPFQCGDPAVTLARIAADAPPSLRSVRPELPPALDRVVLRGLERSRERRWRNLDDLRAALLPFLPGQLSIGGLGMRFGAYAIDTILFLPLWRFVNTSFVPLGPSFCPNLWKYLAYTLPWFVYFVVLETCWGCSLGKRFLGLRVLSARGGDLPGLGQVALRTLLFYGFWLLHDYAGWMPPGPESTLAALVSLAGIPLATLMVVCTMRARNGYRGPHEFLSGTRVVQLPLQERLPLLLSRRADRLVQAPALPQSLPVQIGPFLIRGVLLWSVREKILWGEDPALQRRVWLWLRPLSEPALTWARKELSRPNRLRWLQGGVFGDEQWDAFLAPTGWPLTDLVADGVPLHWREVRPILQQLADECVASGTDGTIPRLLTVGQVWVQPDGRTQLLDTPLDNSAPGEERPNDATGPDDPLSLLGQVAVLALEGRPREQGAPLRPIRAPLPLSASKMLHRLLGLHDAYTNVVQVQAELAASSTQPAEMTAARRAAHLAVLATLLFPGLFCMFVLARLIGGQMERIAEDMLTTDALLQVLDDEPLRKEFLAHADVRLKSVDVWKEEVGQRLERDGREWQARLPFLRYSVMPLVVEEPGEPTVALMLGRERGKLKRVEGKDFRLAITLQGAHSSFTKEVSRDELESILAHPDRPPHAYNPFSFQMGYMWTMIGFFPVIWVLWALVFRGGFSLRLMGIGLLRRDGRKASRLQCAWRALVVWAPITTLLMLPAWLDAWSWSGWVADTPLWWVPWAAFALWWSAVVLLLSYFLLAYWLPARSLHDRLAGTYLVPR